MADLNSHCRLQCDLHTQRDSCTFRLGLSACLRGTCSLLAHQCCPSAGRTALQGCSPCLPLAVKEPPSAPGTPMMKTVWPCQARACCHCTTLPGHRQAFSWVAMTLSSHGRVCSQPPDIQCCSSPCCCTSSGSTAGPGPMAAAGPPLQDLQAWAEGCCRPVCCYRPCRLPEPRPACLRSSHRHWGAQRPCICTLMHC